MNHSNSSQSAQAVLCQRQPWNGLGPATGCVPLGGSAAGAQGGHHV
jgi:hypothetical protein